MYRITFLIALFLVSAGCTEKETSIDRGASEARTEAVEMPAKRPENYVLVDGYRPTFKHVLRSQRHVELDNGRMAHVVIVEFIGNDKQSVIATLRTDLESRKFRVDGPVEHGNASRLTARKGRMRFVADVNDSPSLKLNSPGAEGIVYFSWQERKPR